MPKLKLSKLREVFGLGEGQELEIEDDVTPPTPPKTYTQEEVDAQIKAAKDAADAAAEAAKVTPPEPKTYTQAELDTLLEQAKAGTEPPKEPPVKTVAPINDPAKASNASDNSALRDNGQTHPCLLYTSPSPRDS